MAPAGRGLTRFCRSASGTLGPADQQRRAGGDCCNPGRIPTKVILLANSPGQADMRRMARKESEIAANRTSRCLSQGQDGARH